MKRLLVSMEDERYEDLRRFAYEKKVPMAELVRHAIEETFEDQLDGIAGKRGLEEYLKDPSQVVTLDALLEEFGIEIPGRSSPKGKARVRRAAS
jgi:hypothetical protein